jgi:hypothetical protein
MSGSIISKDETADEQSHVIIGAFNDSGHLLEDWCKITTEMYPNDIKLLALIPHSSDMMSPTKLMGGFLSHDNCVTANKTGNNVMYMILKLGKESGMNNQDLILYQGHCFNHLRNMWFEVIENNLLRKITKFLRHDLLSIPSHLRSHERLVIFFVKLIRNTHSQHITSREVVMLIQIGRITFTLTRDTCHPFNY